jgi:hypothetical protein
MVEAARALAEGLDWRIKSIDPHRSLKSRCRWGERRHLPLHGPGVHGAATNIDGRASRCHSPDVHLCMLEHFCRIKPRHCDSAAVRRRLHAVDRSTALLGIQVILRKSLPRPGNNAPTARRQPSSRAAASGAGDCSISFMSRSISPKHTERQSRGSPQPEPSHATIAKLLLATRGKTGNAFPDSGTIARTKRTQVLLIGNPARSSRSATCGRMTTRARRDPHCINKIVGLAAYWRGTNFLLALYIDTRARDAAETGRHFKRS